MSEAAAPPRWAETILRLALARADRESVSGDLLEVYRDTIVPARGRSSADAWYIRQVAGYLWRATFIWALVFSGAFVARTAYDWFVPTTDFYVRSAFTTYLAAGVWFCAGAWAAWRSGSFFAGPVVTAVTTLVAALFSVAGASLLLAIWHDPQTFDAAAASGGLDEVYALPFMMIVPAVIIGTLGGAIGSMSRRFVRLRSQG